MKRRLLGAVIIIIMFMLSGCTEKSTPLSLGENPSERNVVTIAVMQDSLVENFNTNYYTKWLEKKTGYDIKFVYFSNGYETEYLKTMLETQNGAVDAVFLPKSEECLSEKEFNEFVNDGYICELSSISEEGSNLRKLIAQKGMENIPVYYVPRIENGKKNANFSVLWINTGWLNELSLEIPKNYEELEYVLKCFKEMDPNQNGLADEIPLVTNASSDAFRFDKYLKNTLNMSKKGDVLCERLIAAGLLNNDCLRFGQKQFRELVNCPTDIVGAFTSQSITDVVYPNCAEVIARYTVVPPFESETGIASINTQACKETIGGYIPMNAPHKEAAMKIMDVMLSEEASLIATYGEKNVDFRDSKDGELSAYGNKAAITTINYLKYKMQNKNFAGAGPSNLSSELSDEVNWNGDNSYAEYVDARAVRLYEK